MERDNFYNQAFSLFSDGEFEQAYAVIDESSTISTEECKEFKRKCLDLITQQYIYIIKQEIEEGKFVDAISNKNRYVAKYGKNVSIEELINNDIERLTKRNQREEILKNMIFGL